MAEAQLVIPYNSKFPVLSFAYALYCDTQFSKLAHELWLKSIEDVAKKDGVNLNEGLTLDVLRNPAIYSGYLKEFVKDQKVRPFPQKAIKLVTEDVAYKGSSYPERRLYAPSKAQATQYVNLFLVPELIGEDAGDPGKLPGTVGEVDHVRQQKRATFKEANDPRRPVVSCLAMMFVFNPAVEEYLKNKEDFFWDCELTAEERHALLAFARSKRKHLNEDEAHALAPALIDEFCRSPYVW